MWPAIASLLGKGGGTAAMGATLGPLAGTIPAGMGTAGAAGMSSMLPFAATGGLTAPIAQQALLPKLASGALGGLASGQGMIPGMTGGGVNTLLAKGIGQAGWKGGEQALMENPISMKVGAGPSQPNTMGQSPVTQNRVVEQKAISSTVEKMVDEKLQEFLKLMQQQR